MRTNLRFIFPRLVGATVVVGLAAIIVTTIFKLLVGAIMLTGLVALVKRFAFNSRNQMAGHDQQQFFRGGINPMYGQPAWASQSSVNPAPFQKPVTIVPID